MSKKETIRTLQKVHKICKAGERGFNVTGKAVNNRGLKVMLKTYAQQRHQMADELATLINKLGGEVSDRSSFRGVIHRGRVAIMSTLAIRPSEREGVALREAVVGERTAVKTYQQALQKNLTPEAKKLVQAQLAQVQDVSQKVQRLRGLPTDRLVVRLFNSKQDAETAISALQKVRFPENAIETINLSQTNELVRQYQQAGTVKRDATISGGVGGALWGTLIGAIVGLGLLQFPGLTPFDAATVEFLWGFMAITGALSGLLIGAFLGFFIGLGVSEQDAYLYDASIKQGTIMVLLSTDPRRAPEASQIMRRVNVMAAAAAVPPSGD